MLKMWDGEICYKHGKWACVIDVGCGALMWHVDVTWFGLSVAFTSHTRELQ